MITLIITLFIISIIQFTIYLILEFTNMRRNNKQKLNDDDDKLYNDGCRDIHFDSDICESGNKELNERETTQ